MKKIALLASLEAAMRHASAIISAIVLSASLDACGSEKPAGPPSPGTQPAEHLAFTVQPPSSFVADSYFSVAVTIEDRTGQPVTTASDVVTLAAGNSSGSVFVHGNTATTVAAVQGVARFDSMQIGRAGSGFTLTASVTGLASASSAPFTITPGQPYSLLFLVQPATTPLGSPLPPFSVAIKDDEGNTTADTMHIALVLIPSTGATLADVAAVNGVATFTNININVPSIGYRLFAQADGGFPAGTTNWAASDPFDITIAFSSVSAGDQHTCGITTAGVAYCWGENLYGQLGTGYTAYRDNPGPVAGNLVFGAVSAGEHHTCAVTTGNAAYCWGYNGDGEVGNGTAAGPDSLPVAVSGGIAFASVSATGAELGPGNYAAFTCGVTTGHAAYCWGADSAGELGDGGTANRTAPVAISGALAFATISGGGGPHACGVTTTGTAYCWGDNSVGELGNGTTSNSMTPVAVSNGLRFTTLSARNGHACGVTSTSAAYCWGWNTDGQLGNSSGLQQCTVSGTTYACSLSPVAVSGGLAFTSVSAGWVHTCGLTKSGAAYCWGGNSVGQLGNGTTTNTSTPVRVGGGLTFTSISSGSYHTCGVTTAGSIYCWGANDWGELGNGIHGAGVFSPSPVPVLAP